MKNTWEFQEILQLLLNFLAEKDEENWISLEVLNQKYLH